jgi:hypothetical protein
MLLRMKVGVQPELTLRWSSAEEALLPLSWKTNQT